MTNCDPRIEDFMKAVETENIRSSREVKALVSHVRNCFETEGLYGSYARLIQYGAKSFLQSHGSKGILNISSIASNAKNFDETLKKLLNEYFKTFFESENAVLPIFDGYTFTETNRSKNYNETTTRDIKAMYDDVFDFTARAIGIPPSILKGDVQDNSKAMWMTQRRIRRFHITVAHGT